MRLPNPDHAVVSLEKLQAYCLNPKHPRGRHEARVFASALGITAREAPWLRMAFRRAAREVDAVADATDDYGTRYHQDTVIHGPSGAARVRIAWVVKAGEDYPRLTSCFVLQTPQTP